jgi:hypothetical protein
MVRICKIERKDVHSLCENNERIRLHPLKSRALQDHDYLCGMRNKVPTTKCELPSKSTTLQACNGLFRKQLQVHYPNFWRSWKSSIPQAHDDRHDKRHRKPTPKKEYLAESSTMPTYDGLLHMRHEVPHPNREHLLEIINNATSRLPPRQAPARPRFIFQAPFEMRPSTM